MFEMRTFGERAVGESGEHGHFAYATVTGDHELQAGLLLMLLRLHFPEISQLVVS